MYKWKKTPPYMFLNIYYIDTIKNKFKLKVAYNFITILEFIILNQSSIWYALYKNQNGRR